MVGPRKPKSQSSGATRRTAVGLILGAPLLGAYRSVRGGHRLNYAVLSALMADPAAWRLIDMQAARRPRGHADVSSGLAVPAYGPEVS